MYYAPDVLSKVWNIAQKMGYGQYFINEPAPQTIDDHLYINQLANIKPLTLFIDNVKKEYPPYHHTHGDNLSIIEKHT